MKGILVVHSFSGNTFSVSERVANRLKKDGHDVQIERLETTEKVKNGVPLSDIKLINIPDLSSFDFVILSSPVHGGGISSVMKKFIVSSDTINGKNIFCFVTHFFPFAWMGGNSAISQFKKLCSEKNANVIDSSVVNWKNKKEIGIGDTISKALDYVNSLCQK